MFNCVKAYNALNSVPYVENYARVLRSLLIAYEASTTVFYMETPYTPIHMHVRYNVTYGSCLLDGNRR